MIHFDLSSIFPFQVKWLKKKKNPGLSLVLSVCRDSGSVTAKGVWLLGLL